MAGNRGRPGRSTYNGAADFVFRNALPIAAIVAVVCLYFTLHAQAENQISRDCKVRALTRQTQRTQLKNAIEAGILFRDNSKSPVIRAYFKVAVPKRRALLAGSPPVAC